jgi:hypothetical protein
MVLRIILFALLQTFSEGHNVTECLLKLRKVITSVGASFSYPSPPYGKMYQYSGKAINQLGVYESCWELSEANYVLIEFRRHPPILWSICGPEVCTKDDWYYIVNSWIDSAGYLPSKSQALLGSSDDNDLGIEFKVHFPEPYIRSRFHDLNGPAVAMIIITVIIFMICLIGTTVDLLTKQSEEEVKLDVEQTGMTKDEYLTLPSTGKTWADVLICFSLIRNMKKLMSQHFDDYHPHLYYFDGIRVITIGWVILGTCGGYYMSDVPVINYMKLEQVSKKYFTLPAYSSLLALDVLFWVGGFLYAYFFLNSFSSSPLHWLKIYLKHYLEMLPLFIFVTFFFWTLARFIGFGPWFFTGNKIYKDCKDYWWANLFFLSNMIPYGQWSECISSGWFLSVEMQLFVFTPPLIIIYKKWPYLGWILCGGLIGLGIILGGVVAHHFTLNVSVANPDHSWAFYNYYFNKPYIRMPPYLFGILSGFIYYASLNQSDDKIANLFVKLFKNFIYRYLNLALGISLWLILINVQFQVYEHPGDDFDYDKWSHKKTSAYFAFLRFGLGLAYTCMFTPMSLGYFPWITTVFSSQVWTPWSRLTFTAFLIHVPIIDICMRSLQFAKYFSKLYLFFEFVTMTLIVYFFAVIFALVIDIPAKAIMLMILGKKDQKNEYYEINDVKKKDDFGL